MIYFKSWFYKMSWYRSKLLPLWKIWKADKTVKTVVKGVSVTCDQPFFSVKSEMANFFLVNHDFHSSREVWFCKIIFREMRNKCLIRGEPLFLLCLCYFWQPLLHNKWYCVTATGWLIPVTTRWLVWFFSDLSFLSSVSSISTKMAEAL